MDTKKVSLKDFTLYLVFTNPVAFILFVFQKPLVASYIHSDLYYYLLSLVLFTVISFVWGKTKVIEDYFVIAVWNVLGIFLIMILEQKYADPNILKTPISFNLGGFLIWGFAYFLMSVFLLLIFFWRWLPFLIRYIYENRGNLNQLHWN